MRQVSLYLPNLQGISGVPGLLLSRRVSSYLRPEMHLFAILENSTLRPDCDLLRQVSTVEELVETETAKFIVVGFDFATIVLSPSCSCILLAVVLVQLIKLDF